MIEIDGQVPADVRIRLPTWMRVFMVVYGLFWFGMLSVIAFFGPSSAGAAFVVMPVIMGCLAGFSMYRMFRLEVRAVGDELVVRNVFSTKTYHRSQVEGFRAGDLITPLHKVIYLMSQGDKIEPLFVTLRLGLGSGWGREEQLAQLRSWLDAGALT